MAPAMTTRAYWRLCAENEGGRAILCMTSHPSNLATVYHFAKEAAHYARLLLDDEAAATRDAIVLLRHLANAGGEWPTDGDCRLLNAALHLEGRMPAHRISANEAVR